VCVCGLCVYVCVCVCVSALSISMHNSVTYKGMDVLNLECTCLCAWKRGLVLWGHGKETDIHVLLVCLHKAIGIFDGIRHAGTLLREDLVAGQHFLRD
jgi:hypothetical protein